jgi:cytochrome P450
VPFGQGPRTCPGYPLAFLEMRALLAVLLRSCAWRLQEPQAVAWARFPIPRPEGSLWGTFEKLAP